MHVHRGFLELYDARGARIEAHRHDLLAVETGVIESNTIRHVFGNNDGYYFLVSDRPSYIAQLLVLYVMGSGVYSFPYGVANWQNWNVDRALMALAENRINVPQNVQHVTREHVSYRSGVNPSQVRKNIVVRMRTPEEVQAEMEQVSKITWHSLVQLAEIAKVQNGVVSSRIFWTAVTYYCNAVGMKDSSTRQQFGAKLTKATRRA